MMATVEEYQLDLATVIPGTVVQIIPPGQAFTDVYVAAWPGGVPAALKIGLTSPGGFRSLTVGDSFDARTDCEPEEGGLGVTLDTASVGIIRLAVTLGSQRRGGAGVR